MYFLLCIRVGALIGALCFLLAFGLALHQQRSAEAPELAASFFLLLLITVQAHRVLLGHRRRQGPPA